MVFRLNLAIEFPADSNPAEKDTSLAPAQPTPAMADGDKNVTPREQPRFSLRILAFITVIASLILNSQIQQFFWHYRVRQLCSLTYPLLCISLIWHPLNLYWTRLFKRPLPTSLLIFVETLGFVAFLTLFIGGLIAINGAYSYDNLSRAVVGDVTLYTWNSVSLLILSIIDLVCMVQGIKQAGRDARTGQCPNCNDCVKTNGDEEQAKRGNTSHSKTPEHTGGVEKRYRDEES